MNKAVKWIVWLIVIALIGFGLWAWLGGNGEEVVPPSGNACECGVDALCEGECDDCNCEPDYQFTAAIPCECDEDAACRGTCEDCECVVGDNNDDDDDDDIDEDDDDEEDDDNGDED